MRQFQFHVLARRSFGRLNQIRTPTWFTRRLYSGKLQEISQSTLLSCAPGKEHQLIAEMMVREGVEETETQIIKPGLVQIPTEITKDLIFALQILPNSQTHTDLRTVSLPNSWVEDDSEQTVLTHALVPKLFKGNSTRSAVNNRSENMLKTLTKNFSMWPQFSFIKPYQLSWKKPSKLFQLLSLDRNSFIVSTSEIEKLPIGSWPSYYPGGLSDINLSLPSSPNSAFRKLNEAFWCMSQFPKPGDLCADFGGSPGGFSALFCHYGCFTFGLDKTDFEFTHPNLITSKGDAFSFEPPFDFGLKGKYDSVDWIAWDVICPPEKTLEMMKKMLKEGFAKNIVVNFKFIGWSDEFLEIIDDALKSGKSNGYELRAKSFFNNKNEICVFGSKKTGED